MYNCIIIAYCVVIDYVCNAENCSSIENFPEQIDKLVNVEDLQVDKGENELEEEEEFNISEEQLAEIEMMKKMGLPVEFNFEKKERNKKVNSFECLCSINKIFYIFLL